MIRTYCLALMIGALSLAACQQQPTKNTSEAGDIEGAGAIDRQSPVAVPSSPPSPPPAISPPAASSSVSGENDGSPDITPVPLAAEAARTEKGARANLLAWARGIELREFDQAWALMGDTSRAQTSKAQFNALFHPLRDIMVAVPNGTMEGAAGSSYYSVPTTITGTRSDGSKAVLKGSVVLRRVNDVDGATAEQLRWHIEQVNLKPA